MESTVREPRELPRPHSRAYGITHDAETLAPMVRLPRSLKVSIGMPAGPDMRAIYQEHEAGPWRITVGNGKAGRERTVNNYRFKTVEEAQKYWRENWTKAPKLAFPQKLSWFTFRRIGPDGNLEPDWQAIHAHPGTPTEIPIVFMTDEPFQANDQLWGTDKLKCFGDGVNALRVHEMAQSAAEKQLSQQWKHERYFPIVRGCRLYGCPHSLGDTPACKPHGTLTFSLANDIRVGAVAEYLTTAKRSIRQLNSTIAALQASVAAISGGTRTIKYLVMTLHVEPYTLTRKNGQKSQAYAVRIEMPAGTLENLRRTVWNSVITAAQPIAQLTAADQEPEAADEDEAAAINAEFHPVVEPEFDDEEPSQSAPAAQTASAAPAAPAAPAPSRAATATRSATDALKQRIAQQTVAAPPAPPAPTEPPPIVVSEGPGIRTLLEDGNPEDVF